jgi:hypothetical protein
MACSVVVFLASGCAMNRANITELSQEQQSYYEGLEGILKKNRTMLETSLDQQLKADHTRDLNLLKWERDLQKAEVLLREDANVKGNKKMLSFMLAEINLESAGKISANQIDQMRKKASLDVYDNLVKAVGALKKNNKAIIEYLGSGDKIFALRSLDVEGLARSVSAIRSVQEELGNIEKRSVDERQKESERIKDSIGRARDLLIDFFKKAKIGEN